MTTYATPFYCHSCGGTKIRVSESQQMLRRNGGTKLHADVRCLNPECGKRWWSSHKTALQMSRVADAAATGGGEDGG